MYRRQNEPMFNAVTIISYFLPAKVSVNLTIFDVLGNEVIQLVDNIQPAGHHRIYFNAANLPSGVYFYRLRAGTQSQIGKPFW